MNPQSEQELQQRLKELEVEHNSTIPLPTAVSPSQSSEQIQADNSPQLQLKRFFNWFNSLSSLGKLIVVGVGAMFGLAILRTVLKLVAAVISLGVLAVLLYLAYQFFIVRSSDKN